MQDAAGGCKRESLPFQRNFVNFEQKKGQKTKNAFVPSVPLGEVYRTAW